MQRHYRSARLPVFILALGALLASSRPVSAARFVHFEVSIDGRTVLLTSTWDRGVQDADQVWRYLERLSLRPVSDKDVRRNAFPPVRDYNVEPDRDEPLQATLKGRVIIDSTYGGRAVVAQLKLVREKEDSPWKLAPTEVERTFKTRHKPFAFGISIDGRKALYTQQKTITGDHAEENDAVWRELKHLDFLPITAAKSKGPQFQVQPDGDNPTRGTLQGDIIVSLSYGGHSWGQAKISKLRFIRSKAAAWRWTLDPAEVEPMLASREKPE